MHKPLRTVSPPQRLSEGAGGWVLGSEGVPVTMEISRGQMLHSQAKRLEEEVGKGKILRSSPGSTTCKVDGTDCLRGEACLVHGDRTKA